MTSLPSPDPELISQIEAGSTRVERIEHQGRVIWVKRPEVLRGKLRLYKGDPNRAFRTEQQTLEALAGRDLPVAKLEASGDGYFALADAGRPLKHLLRSGDLSETEQQEMIAAGASALAQLHNAGVSHGRPNLKDMCWQEGQVRFIDFERASRAKPGKTGHADDVILFVFSIFSDLGADTPLIELAHRAYIDAGGSEIWDMASAKMGRLRWLFWLTRLGMPFLGSGSDFRAIKPTFAYFSKVRKDS